MKIKNKFSKNKINIKNNNFNRLMNLKKAIRIKTSFIKPLNEKEKFLFNDENVISFNGSFKKPRGKYLKMSDIFLLNLINKKDCEKLYYGLLKLYTDNYLKTNLGGEIRTESLKRCIMSFSTSNNNEHWSYLCAISPRNSDLYELCKYVKISIFEFSNDLIGIVFQLEVTDKFNSEINEIFNKKYEKKVIYDRYKYKKKHIYSRYYPTADQIRNNKFEDFILEFKCRFNKLFNKYLPLQLSYNNKPPISLNLYQTNVKKIDREESFLKSLDIIDNIGYNGINDFDICIRNMEYNDTFIKTKGWYSIWIRHDKIDRSNNLILFVDKKEFNIISESSYFINLYINSMTFYLLDEMNSDLTEEKYKLYNCSSKKIKKNYSQYEKINKKFYKYSSIFDGIVTYNYEYNDDYLLKGSKNIKKIYKNYYNQYMKIRKEYEFRTNINNIRSSYKLACISIAIAVVAILISIYFEYKTNNIKINEKIKINNEIFNKQ